MHQDLNNTLEEFLSIKKTFLEEQRCNSELRAEKENLQKQNKAVNEILILEGRRHCSEQETAVREQQTNTLLLELKGENLKLSKQVKDLESNIAELKMEKMKLEKHCSELKLSSAKELENTKLSYEAKIQEIENELNKQLLEVNKKLNEETYQKRDEINMLILEYEEKLRRLEHRLITKENENADIQKRATADVAIYQKKMLALEHLCNELQAQRQEIKLPPPGPTIRHQQHTPLQLSAAETPPKKQTPSTDRGFQYVPSTKFYPSSTPRSSTAFLCSPADFQPDTTSTTPIQNKQTRGRSKPNVSKRNIAAANSTETLSKPDADTVAVSQVTGLEPKTTRFSVARKRKLFSVNQNTL